MATAPEPPAATVTGARPSHPRARRVALKRATHRSTKGKGGGILPLIALMVVFVLVAVVATTVVAVASAAGALMTSLEEGLPDVQQFEQLQFDAAHRRVGPR